MPVSAVGDGGKARRARTRVKTRSPARSAMAASHQAAQFQGYCSHCAKWAHKRAECRTQLALMKGRQLLEFKIPSRKVKVSSRRIGAMPKTMKWRSMRRVGVFGAVTTP